jgi:hypothetical protein
MCSYVRGEYNCATSSSGFVAIDAGVASPVADLTEWLCVP